MSKKKNHSLPKTNGAKKMDDVLSETLSTEEAVSMLNLENKQEVYLTPEQKKLLSSCDYKIGEMKVSLANLELQKFKLEHSKMELCNLIEKANQELFEQVRVVAISHNLDTENGGWLFDLSEMKFTKKNS